MDTSQTSDSSAQGKFVMMQSSRTALLSVVNRFPPIMPAPNLAPEMGSPRACINSNYSSYFKLERVLTDLDALGLQGHKPLLSNPHGCSESDFAL